MSIVILGIDLGKNSCSVVGLDGAGTVVVRRRLRREGVIAFASKLPSCIMAMEACCGAHHMGRSLAALGQRLHGRAIERLEKVLTRGAQMTADTGVQASKLFADGGVEFVEAEELPVAQSRDDPALSKKNRPFDLGLVARFVGPRRKDGGAVMRRLRTAVRN